MLGHAVCNRTARGQTVMFRCVRCCFYGDVRACIAVERKTLTLEKAQSDNPFLNLKICAWVFVFFYLVRRAVGRPANNSAFRNDLESNRSRFSVFDDFVVADLLST